MKAICSFLLLILLINHALASQNILNFGAIANEDSLHAQTINANAINQAIIAANSSSSTGDARTIVIPNHRFYSLTIKINYCRNIVIEIQGKLIACNRIKNWPRTARTGTHYSYEDFISISFSDNVTMMGGGKIDGRGYIWWLNSWLVTKKYLPANSNRPHLIAVDKARNLSIHDLVLKNSPCFHIRLGQSLDVVIYNLDIKVNTTAQLGILKRFYLIGAVPMFPLNTDGIDPSGRNFHIYNITCQNYDDVVVPKPTHRYSDAYTNCTENMLIENITVRLGVGLSIGSVPPNSEINCVRNITFRNAHMEKPFKGIYIKTNPGENGYGIIDNILYENITMHEPIWWALYLGPQQQKQPDKGGPGCMLYPFDPKGNCQTQPRINITNVRLKDISITSSLLFPIVLRCNETNPCKNIEFDNVQARGWLIGKKNKGYVCENIIGTQLRSYPKLDCLKEMTSPSELAQDQTTEQPNLSS